MLANVRGRDWIEVTAYSIEVGRVVLVTGRTVVAPKCDRIAVTLAPMRDCARMKAMEAKRAKLASSNFHEGDLRKARMERLRFSSIYHVV